MMKYSELYAESLSLGHGLISSLSNSTDVPWHSDSIDPSSLEKLYAIRSGFKTVIPSFIVADENSRVRVLTTMFADKWTRLWNDFKSEYSPLDAYRVDETVTRDRDDSNSITDTYGRVIDEHHTDGGTLSTSDSNVTVSDASIYGFNSADGVPSDRTSGNDSGTSTETRNLESTDKTTNSGTDQRTGTHTEDETTTTSRSGNIGYTTPQELLRQDIELWHTPFFNLVFDDIDNFIMLQVYSI